MNEEQRISVCRTGINQIYTALQEVPQTWRNYLTLARSIMTHLDSTTFMQQPARTAEQTWIVTALQRLAYMDADNNVMTDIAAWCSRQWLAILQRESQNVEALRGIGQSWLGRAQPVLSRIQPSEGSSSSSGGSSTRSGGSRSTGEEEQRPGGRTRTEAERRVDTQEYVEARQYLQPATEYLERAVIAATRQGVASGDLLATVRHAQHFANDVDRC